jgi:hypothetical protein
MIELVVKNINLKAKFIFVVQKKHYEEYHLDYLLRLIAPNCQIKCVDGLTQGTAETCLVAKELINNSTPTIIVNSDQFLEWNPQKFIYQSMSDVDGSILCFDCPDR